jgi:hypothetical protein
MFPDRGASRWFDPSFGLLKTSEVCSPRGGKFSMKHFQLKGLILAQNERWRRGLGMQVARQVFFSLLLKTEERRKGE